MLTTTKDFKIDVLNAEECKDFFTRWGTFACTCYQTPKRLANRVGKVCFESEHNSGSRAFYFIFDVTEVPRSLVDQLVRHENGVVKNVQSFRYVNKDGGTVYIPNLIAKDEEMASTYEAIVKQSLEGYATLVDMLKEKGFTGEKANEQARGVLPMNTNTGLTLGVTYEALVHLCHERLCTRAEYPIRRLVQQMRDLIVELIPELEPKLVVKCKANLFCTEDKCCGIAPTREEVVEKLNTPSPTEVYNKLMSGIPMRLPEWEGYWKVDENNNIKIHCANGDVLDLRETTDTKYTLDFIFLRHDWIEVK